jgi:hypothetical protein
MGYNDKVIESGFSKASEINRNDLLEYKEKKINKRVPLVLTALLDRGGSIKEGHFGFRHFVCEFYRRMDTVDMFQKFIKLFIAMCPLHVNVIYKSEP